MSTLGVNFLKCWWHHRFRTLYQQDAHPYYFTSGYSWQQRLNWGVQASNNRKKVFCRSYNCTKWSKPFSKRYSTNDIDFFFLTVFHEHRSTPLTGITGKTDQWSHWTVDREVKVETRLMLNNFFSFSKMSSQDEDQFIAK